MLVSSSNLLKSLDLKTSSFVFLDAKCVGAVLSAM